MDDDRRQCSGLVEGLRDNISCPDCGHRVDAHNDDRRCDVCTILEAVAKG